MGGFLSIGISTPILWRPGLEKKKNYIRLYWLLFEIVFCRNDFTVFRAESFVSMLNDELNACGGEVIYHRDLG